MQIVPIIVNENDTLMITVPGVPNLTCVWIALENGKLVFTGGASIIQRIEGVDMAEKVVSEGFGDSPHQRSSNNYTEATSG